jgi:hypothetical protein
MKAKTVRRTFGFGNIVFPYDSGNRGLCVPLFLPGLVWRLSAFRQLEVWAVDKTVPIRIREMRGLFWILN